jgi:hypothetical protein
MEVVHLTVFVSLGLVACSLLLLAFTLRNRTHEHADRLALLPMDDDRDRRGEDGVERDGRFTGRRPRRGAGSGDTRGI